MAIVYNKPEVILQLYNIYMSNYTEYYNKSKNYINNMISMCHLKVAKECCVILDTVENILNRI